jgi:hypothetical protein
MLSGHRHSVEWLMEAHSNNAVWKLLCMTEVLAHQLFCLITQKYDHYSYNNVFTLSLNYALGNTII